jgi:hypothetical protein
MLLVALALTLAVVVVAALVLRGDDRPAEVRPQTDPSARLAALRRAQALVDVRPADLGWQVELAARRDPAVRAKADTGTRTITLFLARDDAAHRTAHDLAHELGHAYDAERMTRAARRAFLRRRGVPSAGWSPGPGRPDYESGAGDFAEVYALCHAASPEFRSRLAPRPANACALLPEGAR